MFYEYDKNRFAKYAYIKLYIPVIVDHIDDKFTGV